MSESSAIPDLNSSDANADLLPNKSRPRYEDAYSKFCRWRSVNNFDNVDEEVLLGYLDHLSETYGGASLWALYSMLKSMIKIKHNIDIANYTKVLEFIRRKNDGYKSRQSKVLTPQNIKKFLEQAPDDAYLLAKVILIIGISGACRKTELRSLTPKDVEDTGKRLIFSLKVDRTFVVSEEFYHIVKKYMTLRPPNADQHNLPFLLNYQRTKCTLQPVGINKIGAVPKLVATFLKLPDPKQYTGHSFKKSSATIFAGGDLMQLKKRELNMAGPSGIKIEENETKDNEIKDYKTKDNDTKYNRTKNNEITDKGTEDINPRVILQKNKKPKVVSYVVKDPIGQDTQPDSTDTPSLLLIKEEPTEISMVKEEFHSSEESIKEFPSQSEIFFEHESPAQQSKRRYSNTVNQMGQRRCKKAKNLDQFRSLGMYVVAKLENMEPDQACFAEALINEILFRGSVSTLTKNTRITQFEKN